MIPNSIKELFVRTPVQKVIADDLHQARLDLLEAQSNSEHWAGKVLSLERTVRRLETYKATAPAQ